MRVYSLLHDMNNIVNTNAERIQCEFYGEQASFNRRIFYWKLTNAEITPFNWPEEVLSHQSLFFEHSHHF